MKHRSVLLEAAGALIAAGLLAALVGAVYGATAAKLTAALLAPVGLITIVAGETLLRRRARLMGLRRQFLVGGVVSLGPLAASVALFCALMFVSMEDAFFTAILAAYGAGLGVWASRRLAHSVLDDIQAVRGGLAAVGEGHRDIHIATGGGDELAALGRDVEAMVAKLAAEERARRGLVAAVSHDLRTPITALQLLTQAVTDDIVDEATRRQYLGRLSTHVRSLSALIDDLFELSRLQSGDIRWTMERLDLDELVSETVDAMRCHADARRIAVLAQTPPGTASARGNPEQLQRVMLNLIQNAIRHTPADGSVTVRIEPVDGGVEVEVADTGAGIAPADRDRVFDAFFQGGDHAARTDTGAGLGLAISRAIVEAHGGRIWLPDTDRGTRVRFRLPAAA